MPITLKQLQEVNPIFLSSITMERLQGYSQIRENVLEVEDDELGDTYHYFIDPSSLKIRIIHETNNPRYGWAFDPNGTTIKDVVFLNLNSGRIIARKAANSTEIRRIR